MPIIETKFDFDHRQLLIDFNSVEIPKDTTYDQNQIAIPLPYERNGRQ